MTTSADALARLAAGDLASFRGIPDAAGRADAEAAFGDSGADPDEPGGTLGPFRQHPPAPGVHGGVYAFYDGDRIAAIRIDEPTWALPLDALGPPEATLPSGLSRLYEQYVYASRGLALHVDEATHRIHRLFAYPPMPVEAFLESELAHVRAWRERR